MVASTSGVDARPNLSVGRPPASRHSRRAGYVPANWRQLQARAWSSGHAACRRCGAPASHIRDGTAPALFAAARRTRSGRLAARLFPRGISAFASPTTMAGRATPFVPPPARVGPTRDPDRDAIARSATRARCSRAGSPAEKLPVAADLVLQAPDGVRQRRLTQPRSDDEIMGHSRHRSQTVMRSFVRRPNLATPATPRTLACGGPMAPPVTC